MSELYTPSTTAARGGAIASIVIGAVPMALTGAVYVAVPEKYVPASERD